MHPILQTHIKTSGGLRTIAALGSYDDMIFSKEMDNAIKIGYKFDILWGYTFTPGLIFDTFVDDLYLIRQTYPKSDPMNYIAKIILNSLYGRFGMNDNFNDIQIIDPIDLPNIEETYKYLIVDIVDIGDKVLIETEQNDYQAENQLEQHNVNIAISSAITGYARIHMSQFKNNNDYKLFYSDTDSIYINNELNSDLVSNTVLGKMKLEYICNKGIFLAPKVYGVITTEGNTIIKVKGLTKNVIDKMNITELETLLTKDSKLEYNQDKWYKSLTEGTITIKEQVYSLQVTSSKRELIYNNNIFQ